MPGQADGKMEQKEMAGQALEILDLLYKQSKQISELDEVEYLLEKAFKAVTGVAGNIQNKENRLRGEVFELVVKWYFARAVASTKLGVFAFIVPASRDEKPQRFIDLLDLSSRENDPAVELLKKNRNRIQFPSPDLVLARKNPDSLGLIPPSQTLSPKEAVKMLGENYKTSRETKINVEDIIAVFSIKNSLRPDRRYQMLLEACSIKAVCHVLAPHHSIKYISITAPGKQEKDDCWDPLGPHQIILFRENQGVAQETKLEPIDGRLALKNYMEIEKLIQELTK